jgi:YidC/Oxa1 family membrane protein insertase
MPMITEVFAQSLAQLYVWTGDLGVALIIMTLFLRLVMLPLTIPSIRAQKKIQQLQPELKKLKAHHGSDRQAYQTAQLELYRKYNINPLSGCLPMILQLVVMFFIYQALNYFFTQTTVNGITLDTSFLWFNLNLPDQYHVLPFIIGLTQFIFSIMILPATEVRDVIPNQAKDKSTQDANKKEEDVAEMAASMQQQTAFMMPAIMVWIGWSYPSGLGVYLIVTTVFSIIQQWILSGPGGLRTYTLRALNWVRKMTGQPIEPEVVSSSELLGSVSSTQTSATTTDLAAALSGAQPKSSSLKNSSKSSKNKKAKKGKHKRRR